MSTTNFPFGIAAPGIEQTVATSPLLPPQGTTGTIFTIAGGPIQVLQLFGIVRTVIGAVANATKLQYVCNAPALTDPTNGLKFPEFKVGYHEGSLSGIDDRYANRPIVLPPDYEAVKSAALGVVEARR